MSVQSLDFSIIQSFYHISPQGAEHPEYEAKLSSLMNRESCRLTLDTLKNATASFDLDWPASMLGRTMFNLTVANLYFFAMNDVFLRFRPGDLTLQLEKHGDHHHLGFRIDNLEAMSLSSGGEERRREIEAGWESFFKETAVPFIAAIGEAASRKPDMIWNQFASGLFSIREYVGNEMPIPHFLAAIDSQIDLLKSLPADWFDRRRNPFLYQPKYIDNPYESGGQMVMRSACCFNDRKEGGEKCYSCPLLKPAEREKRRLKILDEAVASS